MTPTLSAVRLERTRDVIREIARSLSRALPIAVGIAGPLFVAVLALVAWAGLPLMKAPTMGPRLGPLVWVGQTVLVAWPLWALRRRLLPASWCVQLRCLPIAARAAWRTDLEVAAVVLSPVAIAYLVSAGVVAGHAPDWWRQGWLVSSASAIASWLGSCTLGAGALAWQRRSVERGHPARRRARDLAMPRAGTATFPRASIVDALLWRPSWRDVMSPGGPALVAGVAVLLALAAGWTRGLVPGVPGAAWAFAFSALALALTERAQRAMEAHVASFEPFLVAWPVSRAWRVQARLMPLLPMAGALAGLALLVLASRPWRPLPGAGFIVATLAVHGRLVTVPASNREAHVSLWALGAGLATAFGSELW